MPHESDFATKGRWSGVVTAPGDSTALNDNQGVYGVHAALLRTGRVLLWSGRVEGAGYLYRSWSFDPSGWSPPDPPPAVEGRWFLSQFDPGGPNASPPGPVPRWSDDPHIDLFCAHQLALEDGSLLVLGGAGGLAEADARGNKAVFRYDPDAETWVKGPHLMNEGRWYPTAVMLPDARVAVFSGRATGGAIAASAEVVGPSLQPATISGGNRTLYIYPGMVLVRGGSIFYVPTAWQYENAATDTAARAGIGPTASFRMTAPAQGVWTAHTDPANPAQPLVPAVPLREEGTYVLLPPAQAGRILVLGGGFALSPNESWATQHPATQLDSAEILETQGPAPRWVPAGRMRRPRSNVHAVLLPDGKVLIVGGHDGAKRNHANDQNRAEIYDPTVPYDPLNPMAAFTEVGEMHTSRCYHATALLLPDGRVLCAGGEDNQHHGGNQKSVEIYEPPYCHQGPRPDITGVSETGGPNDSIAYGSQFVVTSPQAATIGQVVLMRPGAPTHHTDSEQRHVPLNFVVEAPDRLRVTTTVDPSVAPPGWYMLFLVDTAGRPCNEARFVRLSGRRCRVVTDRSTFSSYEVEAAGGTVPHALYVYLDGFLPAEAGVTTATPSAAQLAAWAPAVTFFDGATQETGVVATPVALHTEDPTLPADRRQRLTFEYSVSIDLATFPAGATEVRPLEVRSNWSGYRCTGEIRLVRQPNPYLLDGPVSWLATDVRVFKVRAGETRFGVTLDATSPNPVQFIRDVMAAFDANPALASHPYESLSEDPNTSRLQIARLEGGVPVFNFAVARLRYRALAVPATDVRAFFRLFTVTATNLSFDLATTYRRHVSGTTATPLLGVQGPEVVTVPFFATPRVDTATTSMTAQTDPANVKTLPADPGGAEVRRYFGAWLDFNQPEPRFPHYPGTMDGPYAAADMVPIPEIVGGRHQCLVAEIVFEPDPTPHGATPAGEDNLAQRNLVIEGSDNPGGRDSHTVALTFDIAPTWSARDAVGLVAQPDLPPVLTHVPHEHAHDRPDEHDHAEPAPRRRTKTAAATRARGKAATAELPPEARPDGGHGNDGGHGGHGMAALRSFELGDRAVATDLLALEPVGAGYVPVEHSHRLPPEFRLFVADELMIVWGEAPRGTTAELYVPALDADDVLALAAARDGQHRFEKVDDHTLRFPAGEVSYVPLPPRRAERLAALLTVELPDGVRYGEEYRIVAKQVSHQQRRVIGSFELRIPVGAGRDFLAAAEEDLAVLGHVAARRPEEDRWRPVLERYLDVTARRVRAFGGDPDAVRPSLDGFCRPCADDAARDCPPGRVPPPVRGAFDRVFGRCRPLREALRLAAKVAAELAEPCPPPRAEAKHDRPEHAHPTHGTHDHGTHDHGDHEH